MDKTKIKDSEEQFGLTKSYLELVYSCKREIYFVMFLTCQYHLDYFHNIQFFLIWMKKRNNLRTYDKNTSF